MKTMETTEQVSSRGVEKRVKRRNWQRITPFAKEKPMADWKKDLQTYGAGRKSQRITQKVHAGRGQETIWEMSDYKYHPHL